VVDPASPPRLHLIRSGRVVVAYTDRAMALSRQTRLRAVAAGLGFGVAAMTLVGAAQPTGFTTSPPLKFREQEIAKDFGVGYAVAAADVDGDARADILA